MSDQVSQGAQAAGEAVRTVGAGVAAGPIATARPSHRKKAARAKGNGSATAAPDPNVRVCSVTLPREVYERYEQRAAEAPFEPSVQRYIAWELRELDKQRQAAAAAQAADDDPTVGVNDLR